MTFRIDALIRLVLATIMVFPCFLDAKNAAANWMSSWQHFKNGELGIA